MLCAMRNPGEHTHAPPVAILGVSPSENRIPICKRDLDWYLDECDAAEPEFEEPAELIFL